MDPRAGAGVVRRGSVSVWSGTALDADALATALQVMGAEDGFAWAEEWEVAACFLEVGGPPAVRRSRGRGDGGVQETVRSSLRPVIAPIFRGGRVSCTLRGSQVPRPPTETLARRMNAKTIGFLELLGMPAQYVVPRWQRRYCWAQHDIQRLVEDLVTVAKADGPSGPRKHYGGTLITSQLGQPPIITYRVVDGQQRLTTVSILLACIADSLGPDGSCGDWTEAAIRGFLVNPHAPLQMRRKLKLQDGDAEEYHSGFRGTPEGAGAVAQAWKIGRRLVAEHGPQKLLRGIERFCVVAIWLEHADDPQQIFETLNATGRPLTESEKLKNWLLMGLSDDEQEHVYSTSWMRIEKSLGAVNRSTERIDTFLRDFVRWKTGKTRGMGRLYEDLRRWAFGTGRADDCKALCRELADAAKLYGILTGAAGPHGNEKVERALNHLRAMEIHTHRPLTLRLLHEAVDGAEGVTDEALEQILGYIGTWITRSWLSDRPMAGMNRAFAELAHSKDGAGDIADHAHFWRERIRARGHTRAGVPDDDAVRRGICTRKAYGGSATRVTKAVLCEIMERMQKAPPNRKSLSVEHVMPRSLTNAWEEDLGSDAERIHREYLNRLANLTITGINPELGNRPFDEKREIITRESSIKITRMIAQESRWDEDALTRRAEYLADLVLEYWPWQDASSPDTSPVIPALWRLLHQQTGGMPSVPGLLPQGNAVGVNQWSAKLNSAGDRIALSLLKDWICLYVKVWRKDDVEQRRTQRMLRCSRAIRENMGDQELVEDAQEPAMAGQSIAVLHSWDRDDKDDWPEAAQWIEDQAGRLITILSATFPDSDESEVEP